MFSAIIFDWGGTLIDNPEPHFIRRWAQALHVSEEALWKVRQGHYTQEFQRGNISEQEYWNALCHDLKVAPPPNSLFGKTFRQAYSPKKSMFELAGELHRRGYRLALLSNCEPPARDFFQEQRYPQFNVAVFSCDEHLLKPEAEIYRRTLERLGAKPSEAIFIDDRVDYVHGAEKAGLHGILFSSPPQVWKELERCKVLERQYATMLGKRAALPPRKK